MSQCTQRLVQEGGIGLAVIRLEEVEQLVPLRCGSMPRLDHLELEIGKASLHIAHDVAQ